MKQIVKKIEDIWKSDSSVGDRLSQTARCLHDEVEHYNWVGFYFHDNDKKLHLGPYTGAATDHTVIPFGKGICGQVAESGETFVVDDVNAQDNYLACSMETKAEVVIPIFWNGENIGQLDIDSHYLNPFSDEEIKLLEDICKVIADGLTIEYLQTYKSN